MKKKYCMCTEIGNVARDGFSTCQKCGGVDAYGGDLDRGKKYAKKIKKKKKI